MGLASPSRAIVTRRRSQHHVSVACVAICGTLALAACGSSSPNSTATAAGSNTIAMLDKFSACMRDHGVSGFPDPSTTETPNGFGIDGYNFDLPSNLNPQSPAYESADKTCQPLIGTAGGAPHQILAKARAAALAHAECMRKHGVPHFPDPTVSGAGGGITVKSGSGGINPQSPAFQQAQKICQPSSPR
jgi:hypothetical protein